MGCIMTPMPNHLSTLKTTPQPCGEHARKDRGEEKSSVETTPAIKETKNIPQDKGRRNGTGSYRAHCEQGR